MPAKKAGDDEGEIAHPLGVVANELDPLRVVAHGVQDAAQRRLREGVHQRHTHKGVGGNQVVNLDLRAEGDAKEGLPSSSIALAKWKELLPEAQIVYGNKKDNFWEMGDTGPCGPCTEIFYDHGDKIAGGPPGSADQDGDRFVEIWNLVFMQYEQIDANTRVNLPKPSVDTSTCDCGSSR